MSWLLIKVVSGPPLAQPACLYLLQERTQVAFEFIFIQYSSISHQVVDISLLYLPNGLLSHHFLGLYELFQRDFLLSLFQGLEGQRIKFRGILLTAIEQEKKGFVGARRLFKGFPEGLEHKI